MTASISQNDAKTIVVKVGSSTLTNGTDQIYKPNMLEIVRQIAQLHHEGYRMLLVTSGAMAAGRDHLGLPKLSATLPVKQMLSAVGQSQLMQIYGTMFELYGVKVGQVLVTDDDLRRTRNRYLNSRDTLEMLLDNNIVPIINENDTVTVEAIKVGDNDNLSALVASLINADLLLLLTDQAGLYDKDPRRHRDSHIIQVVPEINDDVRRIAGGTVANGVGVGGMQTKLEAATHAGQSGIETIIASGTEKDVILRIMDGEMLGTHFPPTAPRIESRKRWLLTEAAQGTLIVDSGAARVLKKGNASLLPVGITAVQGAFQRGAIVIVEDQEQHALVRGQVAYNSSELAQLCGVHSDEIEGVLGYTYGDAAIHRDNLVEVRD